MKAKDWFLAAVVAVFVVGLIFAGGARRALEPTPTVSRTLQTPWRLLRADVNDAPIGADPNTVVIASAGDFANMPSGALDLEPDYYASTGAGFLELAFAGSDAANDTFTVKVWAWRVANGPAALVYSGTGILGTQAVVVWPGGDAATSRFWADTLSADGGFWLTTVKVADGAGNNRMSRLCFDTCGYRYVWCEITSADGAPGTQASTLAVYYSYFNQ